MNLGTSTNVIGMFSKASGRNTITAFKADLPNVTKAEYAFAESEESAPNSILKSFEGNLSKLTKGNYMFNNCNKLITFDSDLSKLEYGNFMFEDCKTLSTFNCGNLNSLKIARNMFDECQQFTTFNYSLKNVTDGAGMFYGCTALTSFNSDLSFLNDGAGMFANCTALTSFKANLPYLTNGNSMFLGCKLNTESVEIIADTINDVTGLEANDKITKKIHIGIGNTKPNAKEELAFNKMVSRGWTVYVNGSLNVNIWTPTSLTPIDGEEITTPIPFYAKPIPATEETAEYVDENGNFFNILGAQFIYGDDLSTYGMFVSLEDAAANMRLTPYSKNQTNI